MSDDRPPRYVEPAARPGKGELDTVVYRASSLGMCERAIVAVAQDYERAPFPAKFQAVLDEGTENEQAIREMAATEFARPDSTIEQCLIELEIAELYGRRVIVRAHADDVIGNSLEGFVLLEYKKFRDSTWPDFLRRGIEIHATYPWQVAAMMHGLMQSGGDAYCRFTGGHFDGERITETHTIMLADPPIPLVGILKRIARLERLIHEGTDVNDVACQVQWPCGFWNMPWIDGCNKAMNDDEMPEISVDVKTMRMFTDLSAKASALRTEVKSIDSARKKLMEAIIKSWPSEPDPDKPVKKVRVGKQIITRVRSHYPEQVRKAYDTDTLKIGDSE